MSAPTARPADAVPDPNLVTALLREQVPELADLPVRASETQGSSNWVFRVGDALAVRLPRSDRYVWDLENELHWLPRLAPHLPVAVPEVVAVGGPSVLFARPWTVVTWVPGELPLSLSLDGPRQARLARSLGAFVRSLHLVDVSDVPAGSEHWGYRCGEPVTDAIDGWAEDAADALAYLFDPSGVREAWRRVREVPGASGAPCVVHTDLSEETLLVGPDGELAGVVDFGGTGVGDRLSDAVSQYDLGNVEDAEYAVAQLRSFEDNPLVSHFPDYGFYVATYVDPWGPGDTSVAADTLRYCSAASLVPASRG